MCHFGLACFVLSQGTRLCKSSFFIFKLLFSLEAVQEDEMEHTSCQTSLWLPCDSPMWREDTTTRGRSDWASWAHVVGPKFLSCARLVPVPLHLSWCCISLLRCSPELLCELLEESLLYIVEELACPVEPPCRNVLSLSVQ